MRCDILWATLPFHSISTNEHSELENVFHDLVLPMPILDNKITTSNIPQATVDPIIDNIVPNDNLNSNFVALENTQDAQDVHSPKTQIKQDAANEGNTSDTTNTTLEQSIAPCNPPISRKSRRQHKPPSFLKDCHCHLLTHGSPPKDTTSYHPIDKVLSYEKLNQTHSTFLCNMSTKYEPSFFHQAVNSNAMDAEISAMERTNTWSIVPLTYGHHVVGCKWVYTLPSQISCWWHNC